MLTNRDLDIASLPTSCRLLWCILVSFIQFVLHVISEGAAAIRLPQHAPRNCSLALLIADLPYISICYPSFGEYHLAPRCH